MLDDLQQPPPAERRPSADSGRYILEASKKNYHCIVCYCFLLNTAVLPCGHTICTDCAGRISPCPLDRTVFVAANTPGNRAVQDAVQEFLLSEGDRTAGAILAAAGAAIFSLGSTTRPLTNPDAMRQARLRAFMHLLPPDPPSELAADPPGAAEAGSDPRGHLGVTWGVYLCAGKQPLADIILSHPPELTRCDSVIGLAIPAMSGHIQYQGAAS